MIKIIRKIYIIFIKIFFKKSYETYNTAAPIKPFGRILQYLRFNSTSFASWPIHKNSIVSGTKYIKIGIGTAPGASFGNYIFANKESPINIGDYTIIAPNVGLAGFDHNIYDYRKYTSKGGIKIGSYCWIAMNSVIVDGVTLGDHTIVAANSVVTKSFPEGYCIIGGNPAKLIKKIDKEKVVKYENKYKYRGFNRVKD